MTFFSAFTMAVAAGFIAGFVAVTTLVVALTARVVVWALLFQYLSWMFVDTWHKWLVLLRVDGAMEPWQFGAGCALLSWIIRGKPFTILPKSEKSSETSPTDMPTGQSPKLSRVRNLDL